MASHVSTLDSRKRVRRTFGQLEEVTNMPNLIDVQRSSYDTFLQMVWRHMSAPTTACRKRSNQCFQLAILLVVRFWNCVIRIGNSKI